jgi:tetratricopeptide (TPR) repeat protein
MFQRLEIARTDSETALFWELLFFGELVLKLSVAGLTGAVADDRDRNRYRVEHRLVRADGLGEWAGSLGDIFSGPAAQHLAVEAFEERREITRGWGQADESWQRRAVDLMTRTCEEVDPAREPHPSKVALTRWFEDFVWLRNRTRAHGAPTGGKCSTAVATLEPAILLVASELRVLRRPWAYLKRNLSGKHRVISICGDPDVFDYLKLEPEHVLDEGIYVFFDEPRLIRLIATDVDLSDFYIANGNFTDKRFEALSYLTDRRIEMDSGPFLAPASSLPASETAGYPNLDVIGETFTNIPPALPDYINRRPLEEELRSLVLDDRHPVITLVGRGGIGKTSLALEVLHQICGGQHFEAIVWFSARDIDLMQEGPKRVAPDVLTQRDIAKQVAQLLSPEGTAEKGFDADAFMRQTLSGKTEGGPFLFVFDNFETVHRPGDLYQLIDTYIRLPNKVLLTSRFRDFKADYPVTVSGMARDEFEALAMRTAARIGVQKLLTKKYLDDLYDESDGHPYIVKMLLGEVARTGKIGAVERVLAGKDEVLDALFERTFQAQGPATQRVFLTLCSWRSVVSRLALEAALLRPSNERMDVGSAVDELERSSLVEVVTSTTDGEEFLRVPLAAAVYGRRKLGVSSSRSAVEADSELLRLFGAANPSDVTRGLEPRVRRMATAILARLDDEVATEEGVAALTYVAQSYPSAWLNLADVYLACGSQKSAERAIEQFLERNPTDITAWRRLAELRRAMGDALGELHARVEIAEGVDATYADATHAAWLLSGFLWRGQIKVDDDEKRVLATRIKKLLEAGADTADATDLSRLAWVCLHLHDEDAAREYTRLGLEREPTNEHLQSLAKKFKARL